MSRHRTPPPLDPRLAEWLLEQQQRPARRGVVVRAVRGMCRFGWTHRRGLAPLMWAVLLLGVGAVLSWTPEGGRTSVAVVVMAAPLLWWRGRVRKWGAGHWRPGGWRYHTGSFAAAAVWLVLAAWLGPVPPLPGILLVGVLGVGGPWWWHHRIRPHDDTLDHRLFTWDELVAGKGGALPGAWLTDLADVA